MSRIYVASSWRNPHQPSIVSVLRNDGHDVYDFRNPPHSTGFAWSQIGLPLPCKAVDYRNALLTNPRAAQGFNSDFAAMRWADTCVLVLPCGRSAHLELGWMAGPGNALSFSLMTVKSQSLWRFSRIRSASALMKCGPNYGKVQYDDNRANSAEMPLLRW